MARAMLLFHKYDVDPIPAPAHYLVKKIAHAYIPSSRSLDNTTQAWHEYLGKLQNWLKKP